MSEPPLRPAFASLALAFALIHSPGTSPAQESARPPGAAELAKKTGEWIETRRLISEEAAAWQSEKATLADLNAIRLRETDQLDEFVKAAGARVEELAKQKATTAEERTSLQQWRRDLDLRFATLETSVKEILPRLPTPLRDKVEDAALRLESGEADRPLQDRVRDVLLVLQAAKEFDDGFTVYTDLREFDGEKREVRVLYLGLSQAWYVDASGSRSGYGLPAAQGWEWTEDASIAAAVRQAIDIQTGEATAAFVKLPFIPLPSAASR